MSDRIIDVKTFWKAIGARAIGAAITAKMSCEDRGYAYRSYNEGFNAGRVNADYEWRNPDNGNRGRMHVIDYYKDEDDFRCSVYSQEIWIDGRREEARGRACQQPDGSWARGAYLPAFFRRYPFVLANDDTQQRMIVCIDRSSDLLAENGQTPLFDAKGEPTEYTQNCIKFCDDFELERRRTDSFVQLLKDLDLFELKKAQFQPQDETGATTDVIDL